MLPWFTREAEQRKPHSREPPDSARHRVRPMSRRLFPEHYDCHRRKRRSVAEPACDGISRLSNPTPGSAHSRGEAAIRDLGDVNRDRRQLRLSVGLMTPWNRRLPVISGKIHPGWTMSRVVGGQGSRSARQIEGRWLVLHQVLELVTERLRRQVSGGREFGQLVRIVEVVAA